ncbi:MULTISPECIES: glutathione S-transferase N-terminal domain-containing protein [unclassified Bradyrhizobium]|uniref:glutathione S-transferase N-terminal domain-containing protein n=1 Tax=unclassified Bradyrhizobium TaxID=2631580 RepID=UPI00247A2BB6|nr:MULTISPECIES: glutathione S-transferase N-terminal domain-containing protein [unclassified Bradyrhizobium]WGS18890.1 glutathione S-transferase C-terminal domain-containing protein [Bradyrhizobium sp. ISRA463]WGS25719.1 glutathione S-transferase C-terminal domain-containing protein [Bradyrhizobium sp. ISRA464]
MTDGRYRLIGSTASPYAIKLRALMRYRRIPHDWVIMTKALRKATAHLKPMLIPVLQYPDGSYRGETTALAHDLEARHQGRSVIPDDKAVAFVCDLLEDLADEWAVKPLFLYRWWDPEDQAYVSRWAAEEWSTSDAETGSPEEIEEFRERQISRMVILGATAENKPLLEESHRRILAAFEPHVGMTNYLFGSRPSLADFAWFGQLSEMATDPTPMRIMRQRAPFTDHWVRRLDDASGVEGAWYSREQALGGFAEALLRIAGELYLPFLVANADAHAKGLDRLEINVWGLSYALAPFKYQVKCLQQLRAKFAALDGADRAALRGVLERTGCWAVLDGG